MNYKRPIISWYSLIGVYTALRQDKHQPFDAFRDNPRRDWVVQPVATHSFPSATYFDHCDMKLPSRSKKLFKEHFKPAPEKVELKLQWVWPWVSGCVITLTLERIKHPRQRDVGHEQPLHNKPDWWCVCTRSLVLSKAISLSELRGFANRLTAEAAADRPSYILPAAAQKK